MTRCAIINCSNTTDKVGDVNTDISYHRFPCDPHIKNKWINATGRKKWSPTKHSRICSVHFPEDVFTDSSKYPRVISTAYPTIDVLTISNDEKFNHEEIAYQPSAESAQGCITDVRSVEGTGEQELQEDSDCTVIFSGKTWDEIKPSTSKVTDVAIVKQETITEKQFSSLFANEAVQEKADDPSARRKRYRYDSDSGDSYTIIIKAEETPLAEEKSLEINDQDSFQIRNLKLGLKRANETIRMKTLEVKRVKERNRRLTKKITKMVDIIVSLRKQVADKVSTANIGTEDVLSETSNSEDSVITDPEENADMETK